MFKKILTLVGKLFLLPIAPLLLTIYLIARKLGWIRDNTFQTFIQRAQAVATLSDSPDLPGRLSNLGRELSDSYSLLGDLKDLQTAIAAYQQAVATTPPGSPDLPGRLNNLGTVLKDRYLRLGDLKDLQMAIAAYQQAVAATPPGSPNLPCHLSNLGSGLSDRYSHLGHLNDLQAGIAAYQQAVDKTPPASPELLTILNNLGTGLVSRYSHLGSLADLQAGINAFQQAVAKTPSASPDLPCRLNNLGAGLQARYSRLGSLADLQASIAAYQQAVDKTPSASLELPKHLNNLGAGLQTRYSCLGELNDLQAGIEACQQAVAKIPSDSPNLPSYLNNLGSGLYTRGLCLDDLNDLQAGIEAYQQAVATTPPGSPDLPGRFSNLGEGLRECYARLGDLNDLQAGISAFQQAVVSTPPGSPNLPSYLDSLGGGLRTRYLCLGDLNDLQAGINAFQQAIQHGFWFNLSAVLNAARNWLNWAFERSSWQEMEQAYPTLKAISDRLVETQLQREHQDPFLEQAQGLAIKIAYARIQTGDLPKAVEALEQGVARLLSTALMRSRADSSQLQQDHPDLATDYEARRLDLRNAERAYQHAPVDRQLACLRNLQKHRKALDDLLHRIRRLTRHKQFLLIATGLETIYHVAQTTPLLYLFTTAKGGYALVVYQKNIHAIPLPELTAMALEEKMNEYFRVYSRWSKSFKALTPTESAVVALSMALDKHFHDARSSQSKNFKAWLDALEEITEWLWQVIWTPLLEKIAALNLADLVLIPIGLLNLLPLHAAWRLDDAGRKRYALDDFTIAYAPNALSLQKARERATIATNKLLAIDEPKPVSANELPNSSIEVNAIAKHFTQSRLFSQTRATLESVQSALSLEYNALHFSCHGSANFQKPLETGLLMANNKMLTVQHFFDTQLQTRLVTLSACETGMIGTKQIEEVVSLPTSLLQAGVAGVASSLWSVSDVSTALLMIQFYQRWRNHYPDNPAEALRQAQQWVRDSKPREKTAFLHTILPEKEANELRKKMGADNYTHPYYWAAFTYVGV